MTAKEDCEGAAEVPLVPLVEDIVVVEVNVWEGGDIGNETGARCGSINGLGLIYKKKVL